MCVFLRSGPPLRSTCRVDCAGRCVLFSLPVLLAFDASSRGCGFTCCPALPCVNEHKSRSMLLFLCSRSLAFTRRVDGAGRTRRCFFYVPALPCVRCVDSVVREDIHFFVFRPSLIIAFDASSSWCGKMCAFLRSGLPLRSTRRLDIVEDVPIRPSLPRLSTYV